MEMLSKLKGKNRFARSPRLDTVMMVEETIKKYSAEFTVYQLWKNLPKKVMYQTYKVIISYLLSMNRIAVDSRGFIGHIWNPELAKKYANRPDLKWE